MTSRPTRHYIAFFVFRYAQAAAAVALTLVLASASASQAPLAVYSVGAFDSSVVIGIDATTGVVVNVSVAHVGADSAGQYTSFAANGFTALDGCTVVPGSVSVDPMGDTVVVQRTVNCPSGVPAQPYNVTVSETFQSAAASVQWNVSADVVVAPQCVASRCQQCVPSSPKPGHRGSCCGDMSCDWDVVFRKYICLPPVPW